MYTYKIEHLKETARLNILSGNKEVYDITHKDIKEDRRMYYYTLKYKGSSVLFKHGNKTKILIYGI